VGNDHYLVQTVANALDVINVFETESEPLSIAELVERTNMNRTTLYRVLYTLRTRGFVEMDPVTGKYRLGIKIVQLSSLVLQRFSIKQVARPYLERVKNTLGATVHLVVLNDYKAIFIDKVEAADDIFMGSYIGWVAPLYCTASGKLLLSFQGESSIQEYLQTVPFKPYTYKTLTDKDMFLRELAEIAANGYSVDNEEMVEGLTCMAAPVMVNGKIAAAVSVSGPTSRINANRDSIINELLQCAKLVSRDLANTSPVSAHRI
jgi:IclR family KDG regulon transcriptional repressor